MGKEAGLVGDDAPSGRRQGQAARMMSDEGLDVEPRLEIVIAAQIDGSKTFRLRAALVTLAWSAAATT